MDKIEKIRQEIERRSHGEQGFNSEDAEYGYCSCARDLLSFLDTLSEEPPKSLNTVADYARRQAEELLSVIKKYNDYSEEQIEELRTHLMAMFLEGTEWQKSQMLKDAMECDLVCIKDRLAAILPMKKFRWTVGDKVRIVVLKEREE